MIDNINPYQGLQNAIRPGGFSATSVENRQVSSSGGSAVALQPEAESNDAMLLGLTERVNSLQKKLDLTLVQYPPFFPIATYQRMDLVDEVRSIQVDVERSSLSSALKQAISGRKLPDDATDAQIQDVLDKVLMLRDSLSRNLTVSKENVRPGSILKLEV